MSAGDGLGRPPEEPALDHLAWRGSVFPSGVSQALRDPLRAMRVVVEGVCGRVVVFHNCGRSYRSAPRFQYVCHHMVKQTLNANVSSSKLV